MEKQHNCIESFYRAGRAKYLCTKCESDVTMEIVMMADGGIEIPPICQPPESFKAHKKQLLVNIYRGAHPKDIRNELAQFSHQNDGKGPILSKAICHILHEKGIYEGYVEDTF